MPTNCQDGFQNCPFKYKNLHRDIGKFDLKNAKRPKTRCFSELRSSFLNFISHHSHPYSTPSVPQRNSALSGVLASSRSFFSTSIAQKYIQKNIFPYTLRTSIFMVCTQEISYPPPPCPVRRGCQWGVYYICNITAAGAVDREFIYI